MNASYLEYYKAILEKVSFDDWLYTKEFDKAKRHLSPGEFQQLKEWQRAVHLPNPLTEEQLMRFKTTQRQFV